MKILFVSYCFPPLGEVGALRVARFCRYLPSFEIRPIVLTAQERFYKYYDESLPAPSGLRIERTGVLATPLDLYGRWKARRAASESVDNSATSCEVRRRPGFVKRHLLALLQIPDPYWGWYWPAVRAAEKLMEEEPIAAVLSSAPPWTSHLVACHIKKRYRVPWVADFRDAWAFDPWRVEEDLPHWRDWVDRQLEASCLRWADLVVSVTDGVRENLLQHHPASLVAKFVVLTNGFDDLTEPSTQVGSNCTRRLLVHAGSLYGNRRIDTFCQAIVRLVESGKIDPASFKVLFMGDADSSIVAAAHQVAPELIRTKCIEFRPRVGWREAQRAIESADLLLIFQGNHRLGVTAKFYEYLQTSKPIFAIVQEGDLSHMLRVTGSGLSADPGDPENIAARLLDALALPVRPREEVERMVRPYHYRYLTGRLAEWVHELTTTREVARA